MCFNLMKSGNLQIVDEAIHQAQACGYSVRQNNEDAAYAGRWLYAVADGMGGHVAGEIASAAPITALASPALRGSR